jgi:hypothetical protein
MIGAIATIAMLAPNLGVDPQANPIGSTPGE